MSFFPGISYASSLSDFADKVKFIFVKDVEAETKENETSQNMILFKPNIVDDSALNAEIDEDQEKESLSVTSGSLRVSTEDIDFPISDTVSVYEVKKGDNLSTVAKLFSVSKNTIIWANDLKSENITPGDVLVILPMTGIKHRIKKGDTLESIAKKYKADESDVSKFNGITEDSKLAVGETLLIPDGEIYVTPSQKPKTTKVATKTKILNSYSYTTAKGFLIRPVIGGVKSQGLHGHNGIDIASVPGTPILAAASGRVIVAKSGGYNGGYGSMVIMTHDNGVQTIYAHLRSVYVTVGQKISQGEQIGEMGNTGRSTGPHLHFEVRGAKNPF